eukprot:TRINITY_DN12237_c0_g1_i1.p1 TRINITY_DN12237_c0_g1~~TRINITY_DN12237_c0_g1_i1.p1  ORF type:complete len:157 (+),score=28.03 TRINITY_DN12237_c0_g1_i1:63-533(+)
MRIIDFAEAVEISTEIEENSHFLDKKREIELLKIALSKIQKSTMLASIHDLSSYYYWGSILLQIGERLPKMRIKKRIAYFYEAQEKFSKITSDKGASIVTEDDKYYYEMSFVKEGISFTMIGIYSNMLKTQIIGDPFSEAEKNLTIMEESLEIHQS